jgi:hypothetical protein
MTLQTPRTNYSVYAIEETAQRTLLPKNRDDVPFEAGGVDGFFDDSCPYGIPLRPPRGCFARYDVPERHRDDIP